MTATGPPPVTCVHGDEDVLVSRAISGVVTAARAVDPAVEIVDYGPGEFGDNAALDLTSPSLFGGLRVVVVRAVHELPDSLRDLLLAYATDPLSDVRLAVVVSGPRAKKIVDGLTVAGATVVRAAKLTRPRERQDFVVSEVRRLGGRISESAARVLLDAVGSDLGELASVSSQLVSDSGGTVTEDVVTAYRRGRAETTGFVVADATVAGDLPEAIALLRQALAGGTAPVLVSSAIAGGIRDLARVATASGSRDDVARQLRMPDWKVDRARRAARGWSDTALSQALLAAADADADVKGAGVDEAYALERAVLRIIEARGRR